MRPGSRETGGLGGRDRPGAQSWGQQRTGPGRASGGCGHRSGWAGPAGAPGCRQAPSGLLSSQGQDWDGWEKGRDLPFTEHYALRVLEFSGWKVLEFLGLLPFSHISSLVLYSLTLRYAQRMLVVVFKIFLLLFFFRERKRK